MEFRNLSNTPVEEVVDCFHLAFSDYIVPLQASVDFWQQRWKRARVDWSLSFGLFDNKKLVAFILHGIENKNAFNVGTGVIPAYRRQRLVNQMYEQCIPLLKEKGITQCGLEVITTNEKAIKAYQSVGFSVIKTYKCYSGTPSVINLFGNYLFEYKQVFNWTAYKTLQEYDLSWENSDTALQSNSKGFSVWELYKQEQGANTLCGYVILSETNGYIAQFGVKQNGFETNGQKLFQEIGKLVSSIKIHNVTASASQTVKLLQDIGLKNYVNQYEMILRL